MGCRQAYCSHWRSPGIAIGRTKISRFKTRPENLVDATPPIQDLGGDRRKRGLSELVTELVSDEGSARPARRAWQ